MEQWRHFLFLQVAQSEAAESFKYMDLTTLQRTLDSKAVEMEAKCQKRPTNRPIYEQKRPTNYLTYRWRWRRSGASPPAPRSIS